MNWAHCLKIENQEFQVRDKMILPFIQLLVQKHWQTCMWLGQEATEWALPCHGTWHPACQLWHRALLQVHRENGSHPGSPVFSSEAVNLKEELCSAYTSLCSEIGSSFSFKVLLLALAETRPPFVLFLPNASYLMSVDSHLPRFPFLCFSFLHLYVFPNFLVSFFCHICYKMHLLIGVLFL